MGHLKEVLEAFQRDRDDSTLKRELERLKRIHPLGPGVCHGGAVEDKNDKHVAH